MLKIGDLKTASEDSKYAFICQEVEVEVVTSASAMKRGTELGPDIDGQLPQFRICSQIYQDRRGRCYRSVCVLLGQHEFRFRSMSPHLT